MLTPDTRHLKPYISYRRACCPEGATFSERSLGKSLVHIYSNPIMFAKDFFNKIFSGLSGLGISRYNRITFERYWYYYSLSGV